LSPEIFPKNGPVITINLPIKVFAIPLPNTIHGIAHKSAKLATAKQ